MALAASAAIAGAAAAYANAKYHISSDLATLREQRYTRKLNERLAKENKQSLWYMFEKQALELSDKPCIWYRAQPTDTATVYSWKETYDHSCRYAQFLLDQGIQPGELVGTYVQNSPEFMFNMLACWAIGCAPAMINFNLAGDALVHSVKVADSKLLVVDEDAGCQQRVAECRSRIEALGVRIVVLDGATEATLSRLPAQRPADALRAGVDGTSPIFLFYTSGTTGFPKACPLRTRNAYAFGYSRLRTTGLRRGDVWYDCMPLYHGTGGTVAVGCMLAGLTLAIGRRFSTRRFWRDVRDSGAHACVYVGETARYLLAAPPSPLDRAHALKAMYGNGLRPDVWARFTERFGVPCVNEFFNSTEGMLSLLNVARGPFHAAHVGHHGAIQRWRLHDTLVPVAIDHEGGSNGGGGGGGGERIWRDPATGFARRVPYAEGGEILVRCGSEADFSGYWGNAGATAARFERDVFRKGDLFYRTGDALRRDADGRWFFLDRLGDTFRWKAENVSTAEVAAVLGRAPGVVEANVYGVALPGHDGRAGCAALFVPRELRAGFDWAALVTHARAALPRYAVPVFVRLVAAPAPMHNNKQNKVPLRNEGVDPARIRAGTAGRDDVMLWLPPGAESYRPFRQTDWDALVGGSVRL